MKAAALDEEHRFEVVEVDDPTPGAGDLVLRVRACGICGSDLKSYGRRTWCLSDTVAEL